ncbi:hypothetical protein CLOP_g10490 [Closterium sp. NIES-67]|nr:hypothetical protein CLOP_g10490 [Closterium sp. NIES-67]
MAPHSPRAGPRPSPVQPFGQSAGSPQLLQQYMLAMQHQQHQLNFQYAQAAAAAAAGAANSQGMLNASKDKPAAAAALLLEQARRRQMASTAALLRAAAFGGNRMQAAGCALNGSQGKMVNQPQHQGMQQQLQLQQQLMFQQWEQQQRQILLMLLQQQRQQNAQLLHQMAAASTRNAPPTPAAATARAASQHTGKASAEAVTKMVPETTSGPTSPSFSKPSVREGNVASAVAVVAAAGEEQRPGSMHEFEAWFSRCCGDDLPLALRKKLDAAGGETEVHESGEELKRSSSMSSASSASSGSSGSFDDFYFDTLSSSASSAAGDSDGQDVEGCDGANESDGEEPLPSEEEFEWHLMSVQTSFL